jgi:hypothetical protein
MSGSFVRTWTLVFKRGGNMGKQQQSLRPYASMANPDAAVVSLVAKFATNIGTSSIPVVVDMVELLMLRG